MRTPAGRRDEDLCFNSLKLDLFIWNFIIFTDRDRVGIFMVGEVHWNKDQEKVGPPSLSGWENWSLERSWNIAIDVTLLGVCVRCFCKTRILASEIFSKEKCNVSTLIAC